MIMRRFTGLTLAVGLAAVALAGCSGTSATPSATAPSATSTASTSSVVGASPSVAGASPSVAATSCDKKFTVGFMPKQTADPFFVAANQGAQEAADKLGMTLIYKGPVNLDPAGQTQIITQWTDQKVDAITVSADDPNALAPSLKAAAAAGIKVSAWNADVAPDAREFFMDNPRASDLAAALVENMVSSVGPEAKILVMTSTLQAPNQNAWLSAVQTYVSTKYPKLVLQAVLPGNSDTAASFNIAKSWLQAHPETQGILTVDGSELAGAAQAVNSLNLKGKVTLVGVGVPSQNGPDLLSGTVKAVVLWNPIDLGYAAIYMVHAQLCGTIKVGDAKLSAGRLGDLTFTTKDTITLGAAFVFTKDNVSNYKF